MGVVVATYAGLDSPEIVLTASLFGCLVFCLANLRLRGLGVVAIGLGANLVPLLVNGTVPVDPDALVHARLAERSELDTVDLDGGRSLADDDTLFAFLGDVIPLPELGLVLSFGDLIIAAGLGAAARNSLRHRRLHGVAASKILADDDRRTQEAADAADVIDLTVLHSDGHRQHPVEVAPGEPVAIPMGWGPERAEADLVGATVNGAHHGEPASPHVPWPWRRNPPPRPSHPTMRVRHH